MKKINRTADVHIEPTITLIVAIFVIVIVGGGVYFFFDDIMSFFRFLPGFNQTIDNKNIDNKKAEIIGWDITNKYISNDIKIYSFNSDNLSYYDGLKWNEFNSNKKKIGNKIIEKEKAIKDIINYYLTYGDVNYNKNDKDLIDYRPMFKKRGVRCTGIILNGIDSIEIEKAQAILGYLVRKNEEIVGPAGAGSVLFKKILTKKTEKGEENYWWEYTYNIKEGSSGIYGKSDKGGEHDFDSEPVKDISSEEYEGVVGWLMDIEEVPIRIRYLDAKDNKEINDNYFCAKFVSGRIIIDLSENVSEDYVCQRTKPKAANCEQDVLTLVAYLNENGKWDVKIGSKNINRWYNIGLLKQIGDETTGEKYFMIKTKKGNAYINLKEIREKLNDTKNSYEKENKLPETPKGIVISYVDQNDKIIGSEEIFLCANKIDKDKKNVFFFDLSMPVSKNENCIRK